MDYIVIDGDRMVVRCAPVIMERVVHSGRNWLLDKLEWFDSDIAKLIFKIGATVAGCIFLCLVFNVNVYAAADEFAKLDSGGTKILNVVQRLGYWIILIKCVADLIKNGMQGDTHNVGKTVIMYVLLYGALYFVPWILRLVEGIF